jgi:hypothetical protein
MEMELDVYFCRLHNQAEFIRSKNIAATSSSDNWSLKESSTLLYYLDHMCRPRNSFVAQLEDSAHENLHEMFTYRRHLLGVNITDSANEPFQREKLIPFLKNVTHSI